MRYKLTAHPDVPLASKTVIVEADQFTRDSNGVTFLSNTNPNPNPAGSALVTGRHEVAWFSKLAAVEVAKDEEDKTDAADRKLPPAK